ncbi:MAG: prepilin-type N-terminal cleavage/methylation domain-containing protein [Candidatus Paceibacterota bacterium]
MFKNKLYSSSRSRGFTLVELMVTVGIFVMMTALVLARYDSFGTGTILTNMAYDIALTIRQAQTYGLSVRKVDSSTNDFSAAYGVHFNDVTGVRKFILFTDSDKDGFYVSGNDIDISTYNLKQGAKIKNALCVGTGTSCSNTDVTDIDITFKRPNPEAIICAKNSTTLGCAWKYAKITITSADSSSDREIYVTKTGEISLNRD